MDRLHLIVVLDKIRRVYNSVNSHKQIDVAENYCHRLRRKVHLNEEFPGGVLEQRFRIRRDVLEEIRDMMKVLKCKTIRRLAKEKEA